MAEIDIPSRQQYYLDQGKYTEVEAKVLAQFEWLHERISWMAEWGFPDSVREYAQDQSRLVSSPVYKSAVTKWLEDKIYGEYDIPGFAIPEGVVVNRRSSTVKGERE